MRFRKRLLIPMTKIPSRSSVISIVTPDIRSKDGIPTKNGAGGVNGGITNGAPIVFRAAVKPTSSIRKAQETFNFATGKMDTLEVPGRHDVCFALRAPVVIEAVTAITLADLILISRQ
jgi:chorismate synthase